MVHSCRYITKVRCTLTYGILYARFAVWLGAGATALIVFHAFTPEILFLLPLFGIQGPSIRHPVSSSGESQLCDEGAIRCEWLYGG